MLFALDDDDNGDDTAGAENDIAVAADALLRAAGEDEAAALDGTVVLAVVSWGQMKALVCDVNGCLKQNSPGCDDEPPASDDNELCRLLAAAANDDIDVVTPLLNAPKPSGGVGCLLFCGLGGSVNVNAVDEGVGSVGVLATGCDGVDDVAVAVVAAASLRCFKAAATACFCC